MQRMKSASSPNFNTNWTQLKAGLISDLLNNPNPSNYFIGLDNLHMLLSQADYRLHLSLYGAGHFYDSFHVGPESSNYELTYAM